MNKSNAEAAGTIIHSSTINYAADIIQITLAKGAIIN